ncbi:MAG: hypothetical protein Q4E38_09285 [Eubacteriales bacterium]|nr:hypothetical protein [Eubacteriales bacterium]
MKKSKKLAVILLTLLMLLSLSACSMVDMPVLKAALNFARLNSAHVVPEGELGLKINVPAYGMNMDILFTADGDLDYCADPLQLAGELRIQAMDETIEVLVYGEDRGGDFILDYSVDGAPWENLTLGKTSDIQDSMDKTSDLSISDLIGLGKELGQMFSGFTKAGQEHVNGMSATRYDAVISLRSVLDTEEGRKAFLEGMAKSLNMDAAVLAEKIDLSSLEDMPLSVWLDDASGNIAKVRLDLTPTMQSLFASGLLDALLASETGLEEVDFSLELSAMDLALSFSQYDSVGTIERPRISGAVGGAEEPADSPVNTDSALSIGSGWMGTVSIANHAGQGSIENGDYEVWAVLDQSGGRPYFEIYDAEDAHSSEAAPIMSFWAALEGDCIRPEIDPDEPWDAWLLNIQLDKKAEDELIFTLEDGVLSASYFYYDADRREACDMSFLLAPEA